MKPKAYPNEIIQVIREKRRMGAKIRPLAKEYFICKATTENYCKGVRKERKSKEYYREGCRKAGR